MTSPLPPEGIAAAKACAHWVTTGLPLAIVAPGAAYLLNFPAGSSLWLVLSLVVATPALSFHRHLQRGFDSQDQTWRTSAVNSCPSDVHPDTDFRGSCGTGFRHHPVLRCRDRVPDRVDAGGGGGHAFRDGDRLARERRVNSGLPCGKSTDSRQRKRKPVWQYANPSRFMSMSDRVLPYLVVLTCCSLIVGVSWSLFFTPDDYQHGPNVKIMFLHVPAALMAINGWLMMLVASLFWLVRRHHVSALAAKAAAPVGFTLTLVALATGAIWGKPAWGTYWGLDPRLTSFLILALFYMGYIGLWKALDEVRPGRRPHFDSVCCRIRLRIVVALRRRVLVTGSAPGRDTLA